MKAKPEPNFYFSAYPLKAINPTESEKKSYLHIYHNRDGEVKNGGHTRILSINSSKQTQPQKPESKKHVDGIDSREAEWFANYE